MLRRRRLLPRFVKCSREILTASSTGTPTVSMLAMPSRSCKKVEAPGACRTTYGSALAIGAGVAPQYAPDSSSRMNSASPGGSVTGSLAHGVRRKKWLFCAQVHPAPRSDTMNPPFELAITFTHGAGGIWSPRT
jgi:hypothetical protein